MRPHVKEQPILQVAARFAVLEQDQGWDAKDRYDILQENVQRHSENLPLQKASEHVHHDSKTQNDEQVLEFQVQESDLRREIPGNSRYSKGHVCYLTPGVPRATKNSPNRRSPDASRHKIAPMKCLDSVN